MVREVPEWPPIVACARRLMGDRAGCLTVQMTMNNNVISTAFVSSSTLDSPNLVGPQLIL